MATAVERQGTLSNDRLRMQGDVPPVPVSEEDEFLSMLKQQANILHQLQQQRGLAPVSTRSLDRFLQLFQHRLRGPVVRAQRFAGHREL